MSSNLGGYGLSLPGFLQVSEFPKSTDLVTSKMDLLGEVFENGLLGVRESETEFLGSWLWELPQQVGGIESLMASPVISGVGEELATGVDTMVEDPVLWTESDLNWSFQLAPQQVGGIEPLMASPVISGVGEELATGVDTMVEDPVLWSESDLNWSFQLVPQTVDYTTTTVPENEPQLSLQVSTEDEVGPATSVKKKKSPEKPTVNLYQMDENEAKSAEMKRKIKKAKNSKAYNDRMKMYANLDPQLVQKATAVASELIPYLQGMEPNVDIREDPMVIKKMQELSEIKEKLFSPVKKK